jgi:hypothetical protein
MNRGRGRRLIFYDPRYYQALLDTIAEAYQRLLAIIHGAMAPLPFAPRDSEDAIKESVIHR